jgi:hypothetical protein
MSRFTHPVALISLVLCLAACGPAPDAGEVLHDYLWRLQNVTGLDASWPEAEELQLPPSPRKRLRRFTLSGYEVDLLDFVELQSCGLGALVGERNSSLGRVMPDSRRLAYDIDFIRQSQACIDALQRSGEAELAAVIAAQLATRKQELPQAIWNALAGSDELARLFTPAAPLLGAQDAAEQTGALRQQLNELLALLRAQQRLSAEASSALPPLDYDALDRVLGRLEGARSGGSMMKTLLAMSVYLERSAELLERAVQERRLCPMQRPTQRSHHLHNVFERYYVAAVQPMMALLVRDAGEALDALEQIRQLSGDAPGEEVAAYWNYVLGKKPGSLWHRHEQAIRRHTLAWQSALGECGLMPGQAGLTRSAAGAHAPMR